MWAKALGVILALSLIFGLHLAQAQTYGTQPITPQNAGALVPLIQWNHLAPLDTPYPVAAEPTAAYDESLHRYFDRDSSFSPDERYFAHFVNEPLTLWLVDLAEGTERAFLLNGVNAEISADWHTLVIAARAEGSYQVSARRVDMDALLGLPRAPISQTTAGSCQFRITVSSTNLRESPATDSASLGYALADQTYSVIVTNFSGDWVQVHGERQPAWLGSQYGAFEGNCAAPPIVLTADNEPSRNADIEVEFTSDGSDIEINGGGESQQLSGYHRAFHPDGHQRAVFGGDGIVRLLDTETGAELKTFILPGGEVNDLEFSPDGRYLLISNDQNDNPDKPLYQVYLWDLTSTPAHVLTTRDTDAYLILPDGSAATFLRDGSGIIVWKAAPNTVGLWDIARRDYRFVMYKPAGWISQPPYPDTLVYHYRIGAEDSSITFISTQTGKTISQLTMPHFLYFSLGWRWIVSYDVWLGDVTIWGVPVNAAVPTLPPTATRTPTPTISATPPGFVPTAEPSVVYGQNGPMDYYALEAMWQTMTATVLPITRTPTPTLTPTATLLPAVTPVVVTPQPGAEVITAANHQQVTLLKTLRLPPDARNVDHLTLLTPDGLRLVAAGKSNLSVWDMLRGEPIMTFGEHPSPIVDMTISRDGRYVLTLADDDVLRLWALDTGTLVNSVATEAYGYGNFRLQLSPDNRRALVLEWAADRNERLRVRDLSTGDIELETGLVYRDTSGGFRPDGTAVWWDAPKIYSPDSIQTRQYHLYRTPDTNVMVPSTDFTRVATFDTDKVNIRIWDTAGGQEPVLLQGHTAPVREVYFSPDARLLVSFDQDNNMLLWDTATGAVLTTIPDGVLPHGMPLGDSRLLIAATDGTTQVVDMGMAFYASTRTPSTPGRLLGISGDGTTIVLKLYRFVLLFGIPTVDRPAYASVPAWVVPSAINVRPQPSLDAAASGTVSGAVIVGGRDASGQFVYLPEVNGWVLADPAYMNLGGLSVEQLTIRPE
ncbi:MAG: WD40 repeat domain-containing protein [Chloroflexi bacterium]|nr:WD40 repeat domain-containing protein [Chloroflexota bacterium]